MIDREEIEAKGEEFQIHAANVQRDYVYGWLLAGVFGNSTLSRQLVLKGGNCFRKAYFATTRFSKDLDFSTDTAVDESELTRELNEVCRFVHDQAGVRFLIDRTRVELEQVIAGERKVYGVRLYFEDFYGKPSEFGISVAFDITEFDRLYLPTQVRQLIHPYSDSDRCRADIRCQKLEELLAAKLKSLLQRRHIPDLYDLAFSVLVNRDVAVERREVVSVFLKKTIFEPAPGAARDLLLGLPFHALQQFWAKYIVCPIGSILDWDGAVAAFLRFVRELFEPFGYGSGSEAFFPAPIRNVLMDAAANRHLLRLRYKRADRLVEPYSLIFKRRADGVGQEYFYAFDRVGGSTGPGIKAFVNTSVESIEETSETFEPQFPVELSRAGEHAGRGYFAAPFSRTHSGRGSQRTRRPGWKFILECNYCNKRFVRTSRNTQLRPHKDRYRNSCPGRRARLITREYR